MKKTRTKNPPVFEVGDTFGVSKITHIIGHNLQGASTGWVYGIVCVKCGTVHKKRQCAIYQTRRDNAARCVSCPPDTAIHKRKHKAHPPELDFARIQLRNF